MDAAYPLDSSATRNASHLGRYRILEPLGQGGMADVMVAVMPGPARFNKLLVIKVVREDIRGLDAQYAQMFLEEARLAALLNHQNVVQTYEVGEHEGHHYIAMEYLEGQSLRHVQQRLGTQSIPLEARLRILIDTARGLHHAHELKDFSGNPLRVVHRDVSPQNIFLTYDGQVKLLDFGIAKTCDAEVVTTIGHIKGKIDYMAPEQVRGDMVDCRADVFALGAVMWELLAGKQLSGGGKVSQLTRVHNRVTERECGISVVVPEINRELARICDKALAHNLDDRYASALDFAHDLQVYLGEHSLAPTSEQLSKILQTAFKEDRVQMRQRLEKALASIEHETSNTSSAVVLSKLNSTLAPPGRSRAANSAPTEDGAVVAGFAKKRFTLPLQLATLAVAIGVAAWFAAGSGQSEAVSDLQSQRQATVLVRQDAVATQKLVASATPAAPVTVATIRLRISTPIAGAHVTLDGATLPRLPFEAEVSKDNGIHQLVATAPGHAPVTQLVVFDGDKQIELNLDLTPTVDPASSARPVRTGSVRSRTKGLRQSASRRDLIAPGEEMVGESSMHEDVDDQNPYR